MVGIMRRNKEGMITFMTASAGSSSDDPPAAAARISLSSSSLLDFSCEETPFMAAIHSSLQVIK